MSTSSVGLVLCTFRRPHRLRKLAVEGKIAFGTYAKRHGVHIHNYLADNGIFKANLWVNACKRSGQGLTFAGVNAHHQNGIAERRIREFQELARTMLINSNSRWPSSVTVNLWPYAVRTANDVINHTPSFQDKEQRSPMEIFSNTMVASNPKHWKPFGCHVYVLDNDLQDRHPFHKWKHRVRVGIYIGMSPQHGRNVALVLDIETALVSPQFRVTFDPNFETVKDVKTTSKWQHKAGFVGQKDQTKTARHKALLGANGNEAKTKKARTASTPEGGKPTNSRKRKLREAAVNNGVAGNPGTQEEPSVPAAANVEGVGSSTPRDDPGEVATEVTGQTTRSGRKTKSTPTLISAMYAEDEDLTSGDVPGEIFCLQAIFSDDLLDHQDPLLAYKAVSDPDTLYYHQAIKEHDREKFEEGMSKEINDQFENRNFTVIHKSRVPKDQVVLPAVWQMRRKRDARTGQVKKYKARLNIDGSRMRHVIHYDQTYSPVASWNSVRMLLTLTAVLGWHTKQIDFVQAFAQTPVEKTLYRKIPAGVVIDGGMNPKDYVLQIHRNIYGQKQACKNCDPNSSLSSGVTYSLGLLPVGNGLRAVVFNFVPGSSSVISASTTLIASFTYDPLPMAHSTLPSGI